MSWAKYHWLTRISPHAGCLRRCFRHWHNNKGKKPLAQTLLRVALVCNFWRQFISQVLHTKIVLRKVAIQSIVESSATSFSCQKCQQRFLLVYTIWLPVAVGTQARKGNCSASSGPHVQLSSRRTWVSKIGFSCSSLDEITVRIFATSYGQWIDSVRPVICRSSSNFDQSICSRTCSRASGLEFTCQPGSSPSSGLSYTTQAYLSILDAAWSIALLPVWESLA